MRDNVLLKCFNKDFLNVASAFELLIIKMMILKLNKKFKLQNWFDIARYLTKILIMEWYVFHYCPIW